MKSFVKPLVVTAVVGLLITFSGMTMASRVSAAPDYSKYINYEVSKEDLKNAKNARDKARRQAAAASSKVSKLKKEKKNLKGELKELNALSDEQRAQYEVIAGQLEAALTEKADALDAYVLAQENLTNQQELFTERVSVMFEFQNKSTLEVLLESDSLAGFFTNMEIITLIADADKQAIDQMQIALDDAELQSEMALQKAEEMQQIADEKQAQLDELEKRIGVTTDALADVETQIDSWEAQEEALNELSRQMAAEANRLQKQYDAENPKNTPTTKPSTSTATSTPKPTKAGDESSETTTKATNTPTPTPKPSSSGVSLMWPVTCRRISSYYGYRIHPIYGDKRFHAGIDISGSGATYGSTIVAAEDGTVITKSYPVPNQNKGGTGYGNYLVISHGNGITTLYGHMKNICVNKGDKVKKGQKIGTVGSTGGSTGAHLHFEVWKNGSTTNPLSYLP